MRTVTITLPDDLLARLAALGIDDDAALNQYAVATIAASLEVDEAAESGIPPRLSGEDHAAIAKGIADVEAGRMRPASEFFDEFRRRHGLPPFTPSDSPAR